MPAATASDTKLLYWVSDCLCITWVLWLCVLFWVYFSSSLITSIHEVFSPFCPSASLPHPAGGEVSKRLGRGLVASQGQPTPIGYGDNHHNVKLKKWLGLQEEVASPCPSLKQDAAKRWIKYIMPLREHRLWVPDVLKISGDWQLDLTLFERQRLLCPNSAICFE